MIWGFITELINSFKHNQISWNNHYNNHYELKNKRKYRLILFTYWKLIGMTYGIERVDMTPPPVYDSGKDWSVGFSASFDSTWRFFRIRTIARSGILKPVASALLLCARRCAWRTTKGNILKTSSESLNSHRCWEWNELPVLDTFEQNEPYLRQATGVTCRTLFYYATIESRVNRQFTCKRALKLIFLTRRI